MNYCQCLLLPIERKGVEPIMARLAPDPVRGMHQFLHRIVADAPWQDSAVLDRVPQRVLPAMTKKSPLAAWIVDDTGLPKKGRHSVGVACPYCGQFGKQEICRVGHFGGRGWRGFHPHATLCIAAYGFLVAD
jgi:SRSO17 transposase